MSVISSHDLEAYKNRLAVECLEKRLANEPGPWKRAELFSAIQEHVPIGDSYLGNGFNELQSQGRVAITRSFQIEYINPDLPA